MSDLTDEMAVHDAYMHRIGMACWKPDAPAAPKTRGQLALAWVVALGSVAGLVIVAVLHSL